MDGWMTVNWKENSCHIIVRYWHCTCLGLRKTTKNLLRTGGILFEVQNGHLLNMSEIILLEPTCSIKEMILLKNNYQETKWGTHKRQEWVATDTRNVLWEYSKNWKRLVKIWVTVISDVTIVNWETNQLTILYVKTRLYFQCHWPHVNSYSEPLHVTKKYHNTEY